MLTEYFYQIATAVSCFGAVFISVLTLVFIRADKKHVNLLLLNLTITSIFHCIMFVPLWVCGKIENEAEKCTRHTERVMFILCTGLYIEMMFTVSCVAVERYLAVFHPFFYKGVVTQTKINICLICTWTVTACTRIPHLVTSFSLSYLVRTDVALIAISLVMQPIVLICIYSRSLRRNKRLRRNRMERTMKLVLLQLIFVGVICLLETMMDLLFVLKNLSVPSEVPTNAAYAINLIWINNVIMIPTIHIVLKSSCLAYLKSIFLCKRHEGNQRSLVQRKTNEQIVAR